MQNAEYPFFDALAEFGDPDLAAQLKAATQNLYLGSRETKIAAAGRIVRLHSELFESVLRKLQLAELIASRSDGPVTPGKYPRRDVGREIWLVGDFNRGKLLAQGDLEIPGVGDFPAVRIRRSDAVRIVDRDAPSKTTEFARPTEVDLRTPDEVGDERLRWSKHFQILSIDGKEMRFLGVQLQIIDQLVAAYLRKEVLSRRKVLDNAKSKVTTFEKAFKGSPNWGFLSSILRVNGDRCQLVLPAKA